MKPDIKRHLTDEALDDVLIGLGSQTCLAHLATCSVCRSRIEAFESGMGLFKEAAHAYSEAQAVRTVVVGAPARHRIARPLVAAWSAAVALLLLAGPTAWHLFAPHPVHAPAIATGAQDTEAQIAEDNELMQQVNAAIAPDMQTVVDQLNLNQVPAPQEGLNAR